MKIKQKFGLVLLIIVIGVAGFFPATGFSKSDKKTAIVLASFGTSYPGSLKAITNIEKEIKKSFPGVLVKHAFTSNIIRKIWHERKSDKKFFKKNKNISKDFVNIQGPLATIANLNDEGYRNIIVQPTHVFAGEEYTDLTSYIDGLNKIKTLKEKFMPFEKLVIGRPALGKPGDIHPYHKDILKAAKALKKDVAQAKKNNASLVYMGHGNDYFSTGIYAEFQKEMNLMYPLVSTVVGCVEGFPSIADVEKRLKHQSNKNIVMKPFMVVSGDHAQNDMAGEEDDSWKVIFEKAGFNVKCKLKGLGENNLWAKIYVQHIKDIAKDNKIDL